VDYVFPWNQLLPDLKFRGQLNHAPWLASLLLEAVRAAPPSAAGAVELITPVPLADARLSQRGFNQAAQLARPLARALALPLDETVLLRWRSTSAQSALHRQERLHNLGSAFMPHPLARQRLQGRHVALVDDVLTTGATLRAATAALLEGGARAVSLWVVARTPSPRELQAMQAEAASDPPGVAESAGDNARYVPHRFSSP
jgi:ComF family protein